MFFSENIEFQQKSAKKMKIKSEEFRGREKCSNFPVGQYPENSRCQPNRSTNPTLGTDSIHP